MNKHPRASAVLNEDAVRRIRKLASEGWTTRALVQEFDVGFETIRRIIRWETWRWVSEAPSAGASIPPAHDAASSLARLQTLLGTPDGDSLVEQLKGEKDVS
jgi:hypothetical protein